MARYTFRLRRQFWNTGQCIARRDMTDDEPTIVLALLELWVSCPRPGRVIHWGWWCHCRLHRQHAQAM